MKFKKKHSLFIFGIFLLLTNGLINADVISLNSGGDNNLIINSGININGFFTGPSCGDGVCDTDESCTSCAGDCGACPSLSSSTSSTSSSSSSGGSTPLAQSSGLTVEPEKLFVQVEMNKTREYIFNVTNIGTTTISFSLSQQGLFGRIQFEDATIDELKPGKSVSLKIIFIGSDKIESVSGSIYFGTKSIPVTVSIVDKIIELTSAVSVLNSKSELSLGDKLSTLISLTSESEDDFNVTLVYVVKDSEGNVYLSESEDILFNQQIQFEKQFDTSNLSYGQYAVDLEMKYLNLTFPSSASFEIVEPIVMSASGKILFFIIIVLFILGISALGFFIVKNLMENKEEIVYFLQSKFPKIFGGDVEGSIPQEVQQPVSSETTTKNSDDMVSAY